MLGSGKEFGVKLSYEIQEEAGGIAQALALAEDFADNEPVAVILGDNIFEDTIEEYVKTFEQRGKGAHIFLKEVGMKAARRFGVAVVDSEKVLHVEEKPMQPRSRFAMTGLYIFDSHVFTLIKTLTPSRRGELEITDTIDMYVKRGECNYSIVKGFWSDAGTFESLNRASNLLRAKEATEEDFWSDTDDFSENFKFPSKQDNPSEIIEKLSKLNKKQSEILDHLLHGESKKEKSTETEIIDHKRKNILF